MSKPPQLLAELTADLNDLARFAGGDDVADLLRRGLEWVGRRVPYDLASVFMLEGSRRVLRAAAGALAVGRVLGQTLDLDRFPSIREAFCLDRARAFREEDHRRGGGDPLEGVLDPPPGHACMVVPLAAGERTFGVLTLDRAQGETFADDVVRLVEHIGRILGLAVMNAERAAARARLERQERNHAAPLSAERAGGDDVFDDAASPAMRETVRRARQAAPTKTPLPILGETGVGKERLARTLHRPCGRGERPFVKLNCAAVPAGLMESELFGHAKDAFLGAAAAAAAARLGRFQTADGGTLPLDEVGEMPLASQAKSLRVSPFRERREDLPRRVAAWSSLDDAQRDPFRRARAAASGPRLRSGRRRRSPRPEAVDAPKPYDETRDREAVVVSRA